MAGDFYFGAEFQRGDGATPTEAFTAVADILDISGPTVEVEEIDVTSHGSPNRWREFIPGLKNGGEVTFELNFQADETTHTQIQTDINSNQVRNYRIVLPAIDATTYQWTFAGFPTAFEPEVPFEDKATASVTFKVTGQVTFGTQS